MDALKAKHPEIKIEQPAAKANEAKPATETKPEEVKNNGYIPFN
ncbi:outer membrane protein [Actinobacillus equuli]|nr:outer membrane protein [Actinobacillus equuli]